MIQYCMDGGGNASGRKFIVFFSVFRGQKRPVLQKSQKPRNTLERMKDKGERIKWCKKSQNRGTGPLLRAETRPSGSVQSVRKLPTADCQLYPSYKNIKNRGTTDSPQIRINHVMSIFRLLVRFDVRMLRADPDTGGVMLGFDLDQLRHLLFTGVDGELTAGMEVAAAGRIDG